MTGGTVKRSRRGGRMGASHKADLTRDNKASSVDETNPVVQQFRVFQQQLDSRHDKHERIVKLSRDITIESKRAIFQLHRISRNNENLDEVITEAEARLAAVQDKWHNVARELRSEDPYQFLRAYSPGLQEYIEALSMLHYLKNNSVIPLCDVEKRLQFAEQGDKETCVTDQKSVMEDTVSETKADNLISEDAETVTDEIKENVTENLSDKIAANASEEMEVCTDTSESCVQKYGIHVPPVEYMLGLADLTGELMRMAIHKVANGDLDSAFQLCSVIRTIHNGFVTFGNLSRELLQKLHTLKQSLGKVETACYMIQIRGSEMPKHMLADVFSGMRTEGGDEVEMRMTEEC